MTFRRIGSARRLVRIAGWRARLGRRRFLAEAVGSPQGLVMILVLIVAAPVLWSLVAEGGAPDTSELHSAVRVGVLAIAHVALLFTFILILPLLLFREFVLNADDEPLLAHPVALPELAVLRVGTAILFGTAFLWGSFYLFYGHEMWAFFERPWRSVGIHAFTGALTFVVLGILVAGVCRITVLRRYLPDRAESLYRWTIVPFLAVYPLFVLAPDVLLRWKPEHLGSIGEYALRLWYLPQLPLTIASLTAEGAWIGVLAASSFLGVLSVWTVRGLWSWRSSAFHEFPVDLLVQPAQHGACGIPRRLPKTSFWRNVRLFWAKDIVLPVRRHLAEHLGLHGLVLVGMVSAFFLVDGAAEAGALDRPDASTGLTIVLILALGAKTMGPSLSCLGREGGQLALLRPVLSAWQLMWVKSVVCLAYGILHAVPYGLMWTLGASMRGLSGGASPWWFMLEALVGTAWMAFLGVSVGCLLPDLQVRGTLLPGASRAGKATFALLAALGVASYAGIRHGVSAGPDAGGIPVGSAALWALIHFGIAAGLFYWAGRRLERVES